MIIVYGLAAWALLSLGIGMVIGRMIRAANERDDAYDEAEAERRRNAA